MGVFFDLSSCVSSEWKGGTLLVAPDLLGDEASGRGLNSIQPLGIFARPRAPKDGQGVGCLYGWQGDDGFIMPTEDPTAIGRVPRGPEGSTVLYGHGEGVTSYHYIDGETGYHQLLVKYGNKSLSITLDTSPDGQESIDIRHGEGHAVKLTADKKVLLTSSNGQNYIELSDTGTVIQGPLKVMGAITGGGASGQPVTLANEAQALLAAVNSTLIAGLAVSGPKATLASPIVVSLPGSSFVAAAP